HTRYNEYIRRALQIDSVEVHRKVLNEHRGDPFRRLVDEHDGWPAHQTTRDRQHLLLAAREETAAVRDALAQPREVAEHLFQDVPAAVRSRAAEHAQPEVLQHGQI